MNGSASGNKINYSLRPAKAVERKMIKDLIFVLHPFGAVSKYKYIGFGSKYFSDFKLFHKSLHISDMLSIEWDVKYRDKYEFNKPFNCIRLEFGHSNEVLSNVDFDKKFIAWLDYDIAINETMLNDVGVLIDNLVSGSLVLPSYNAIAPKQVQLREEFKDQESDHSSLLKMKLKKLVPSEFIPMNIPKQGLAKVKVYSSIVKSIFENKIKCSLLAKNAALKEEDKWLFHQVVYFNYKDGADMSTVGWVFYPKKDKGRFENCKFDSLEFYRNGEDACQIEIPNLTNKEIEYLQEFMPLDEGGIDRDSISEEIYSDQDILSFSKVYKYFPNFMDIETA